MPLCCDMLFICCGHLFASVLLRKYFACPELRKHPRKYISSFRVLTLKFFP